MPGNDVNGGFATHMIAPAKALVSLEGLPATVKLDALSVVADAVSTAYQAVRRSGLERGDVAFVVGAGGVGGFVAQIARALGAHVVVCDVSEERLASALTLGAARGVNVAGREARDLRKQLQGLAGEWRVRSLGWRVFECSGTSAGQTLAYSLVGAASTLVVTGYTREAVSLRLSNLMAFDATVHGTWGAPADAYPGVLELIAKGAVQIEPVIERAPMSRLVELMGALARHELSKRMVLDPRA
jgi:6-hydroxycyclohex-1-ene-1-carbonyl-CoA dehydrogenase